MADRDSRIAAYLDGVLTGEDRARFEADLREDASLARAVQQWQDNDALLRKAFPLDEGGLDSAMLDRLGLGRSADGIDALPRAANDNRWFWQKIGMAGGAIAASLAVAWLLLPPEKGDLADDVQFQMAMESLPSGQTVLLAGQGRAGPVLTFRSGDGRYCREFAGERIGGGVACRVQGRWSIEARTNSGAALGTGDAIRTAAGRDPAALQAAMDRLNASDPLDGEKEKNAISSAWKK